MVFTGFYFSFSITTGEYDEYNTVLRLSSPSLGYPSSLLSENDAHVVTKMCHY